MAELPFSNSINAECMVPIASHAWRIDLSYVPRNEETRSFRSETMPKTR